MKISNLRLRKTIAVSLALIILTDALLPKQLFALTSGPGTPEFAGFTPVNSNNLVDTFSGSFSYNLPVLNVPGPEGSNYAISLSYNSGVSSEQEASWVGFGWTLNPGSITRQLNGFPDDYNEKLVTYYNKTVPNYTITAKQNIGLEFFGVDDSKGDKTSLASISFFESLRYNNYYGMVKTTGFGLGIKGVGIGLNIDGKNATFNASLNPLATLDAITKMDLFKQEEISGTDFWKNTGTAYKNAGKSKLRSVFGISTTQQTPKPQIINPSHGVIINWTGDIQGNGPVPVGVDKGFATSYSKIVTDEKHTKVASGYYYPSSKNEAINDYYVEKAYPFTERTTNLGIPFNAADQFIVSGEGIGGGFRAYHSSDMVYHPNYSNSSKTNIYNWGTELAVGLNVGVGVDFGIGSQKTESKEWEGYSIPVSSTDPTFCFNNDMGGEIDYSNAQESTTNAESAVLRRRADINIPGFKDFKPVINQYSQVTDNFSRSSTIIPAIDTKHISFNKQDRIEKLKTDIKDDYLIKEFQVINKDGNCYQYGLPVFVKNEAQLQFDVDNETVLKNPTKTRTNKSKDNYLTTKEIKEDDIYSDEQSLLNSTSVVTGEKKTAPYAQSYLLTQITSPQYVDVDENGPTNNDYGSWTKFDYRKVYGTNSDNYYKWRLPYSGLLYNKNELSNPLDDMGSLSMGEKEVYYLKAIETKTHVAFFITNKTKYTEFDSYFSGITPPPASYLNGSQTDRYDGLDASANASDDLSKKGINQLEKLERIVLYSKSDFSKPLQTTYFEYNNSLVKNLPNSVGGDFPDVATYPDKSGKLTLKRVWSESGGTMKSKISPYVFSYEYMVNYPTEIKNKYPDIVSYGATLPESVQNPDYLPQALSIWGTNQYNGLTRFKNLQPWLYQGDIPDDSFDPGAWNLKRIKLPSGGEIQIQYDQNEYCYVQDRRAMSLVSINEYLDDYKNATYSLNLTDLGGLSNSQIQAYANQLRQYFLERNEKIYFKFLYKLIGSSPQINDLKSEYISGYASVESITVNNNKLLISLKKDPDNNIYTPRQICYDYVINRKGYKLDQPNNITWLDTQKDLNDPNFSTDFGAKLNLMGVFLRFATEQFYALGLGTRYKNPIKDEIGRYINGEFSYLKVPMPDISGPNQVMKSKRGGGPRVKRLLMYDPGIESGDAALYGSEYLYLTEEGNSSGVATNEPQGGKEENALVGFLPLEKQGWLSKLISGPDKSIYEGPVGESILPDPSIGYSRIVVKNIHNDKTGTGFSVEEYYTSKDYPFDFKYSTDDIQGSGVDQTSLSDIDNYSKKDKLKVNLGLFSYHVNKHWAAQGFRFIINNMHGKLKSNKAYSGVYSSKMSILASNIVSGEEYEYFQPGENIDVWDGNRLIENYCPGKQVEITSQISSIKDETIDLNLEFDISITLNWLPVPFATIVPQFSYQNIALNTFATSKVIKYPAIIKKVRSFQDGVSTQTENLVFNYHTGDPVLVRTFDGFHDLNLAQQSSPHDGSIYTLNIPASLIKEYSVMGPITQINPANTNQLNQIAASFTTYAYNPFSETQNLSEMKLGNLLNCQVSTYKDKWFVKDNIVALDYSMSQDDVDSLQKKWLKKSSYTFQVNEVISANNNGATYNSGYISEPIPMFNWSSPDAKWIKLNEIDSYSPHGEPIQETDILNINSSVKYGYSAGNSNQLPSRDKNLPVLIAKNGKYSQVAFNDFETHLNGYTSESAHSGTCSYLLKTENPLQLIKIPYNEIDNNLITNGAIVKLWARNLNSDEDITAMSALFGSYMIPFKKLAQSGKWSLYVARIDGYSFNISTDFIIELSNAGDNILIDDVIFHPTYSEVNAFVYDKKTLKLLTKFGSSHFGLFYNYNKEGQLVRKMIETEKGLKTVQETQYHSVVEDRLVNN